jgi:hypothetical protein
LATFKIKFIHFFIYKDHSPMDTWKIFLHSNKDYVLCVTIFFFLYSIDMDRIFFKRFGHAHAFMLACSCSWTSILLPHVFLPFNLLPPINKILQMVMIINNMEHSNNHSTFGQKLLDIFQRFKPFIDLNRMFATQTIVLNI